MQNIDIKDYIEELNNKFIEIKGGSCVFLETSEIFTKSEVAKYIQLKIEDFNVKQFAEIKHEAINNGIELDQTMYNKRSKKTTKSVKDRYDGGNFNMIYRERLGDKVVKLNATEKGVWYSLGELATYPTNTVMINNEIPTIDELGNYVGMSDRNLRRYLGKLEEMNLIKSIQYGYKKAYVMNPEYYATGKDLDLKTLKLFGLVEIDEDKINSYM